MRPRSSSVPRRSRRSSVSRRLKGRSTRTIAKHGSRRSGNTTASRSAARCSRPSRICRGIGRRRSRALIREVWGGRSGSLCLDCCCGSGAGTAALHAAGIRSLAYDNDSALLSLGLARGRLSPSETVCIDGRAAATYISPAPLGAAFMAGEITAYNAEMWEGIVDQLLALTDETLITLGTEQESGMVRTWCLERERKPEVFENDRDPLYDRWCCLVR